MSRRSKIMLARALQIAGVSPMVEDAAVNVLGSPRRSLEVQEAEIVELTTDNVLGSPRQSCEEQDIEIVEITTDNVLGSPRQSVEVHDIEIVELTTDNVLGSPRQSCEEQDIEIIEVTADFVCGFPRQSPQEVEIEDADVHLPSTSNECALMDTPRALREIQNISGVRRRLVEYDSTDDEHSGADNHISDFSDYEETPPKLSRCKSSKKESWKVNVTKENRSQCLQYANKHKNMPAKTPQTIDCSNCKYKCNNLFTERERMLICKTYWGLKNYKHQKDFLLKNIEAETPKRFIDDAIRKRRRTLSKKYSLENGAGRHRVCGKFFEKTLNISNGPIVTAFKNKSTVGSFNSEDTRGKSSPANKTPETARKFLKDHIESFPCMESHYVRKTSKRLYLDSSLSISKMYDLYTDSCREKGVSSVSETVYRRIFCKDYNMSFFKPKKDLCSLCSRFNLANLEKKSEMEEEYSLHIIRKNECNEEKEKDKVRSASCENFLSANFDLQSVLQMPHSSTSNFYYSRKINVYNLTIYVGYGNKAHCFTWNELHGKRGSNEIGSILHHFLQTLPESVEEVSLFCDTCGGQNRNQQVAALLLHAVQNITNLKVIELKFLESGHSHMECDSMHSAIESAKKNKNIFTMADWTKIFEKARSVRKTKKEHYSVKLLKFSDFYDLSDLSKRFLKNRNRNEAGSTISWLKIKALRFEKGHVDCFFYKYRHTEEYQKINIAGRGGLSDSILGYNLKNAYNRMLPISVQKKCDLLKLCRAGLIPEELHPWYEGLPSVNSGERERLLEPSYDETSSEE